MILKRRHIAKAITWRTLSTATTFLIAYALTNDISLSLEIGFIEFFLKMFLYYGHERFWYKNIRFGVGKNNKN